jgi:hypothetical protein
MEVQEVILAEERAVSSALSPLALEEARNLWWNRQEVPPARGPPSLPPPLPHGRCVAGARFLLVAHVEV